MSKYSKKPKRASNSKKKAKLPKDMKYNPNYGKGGISKIIVKKV